MANLKTNQRRVDKPHIPAPVALTSDQVNPSSDHDPVISTQLVEKKLYQANVFCTLANFFYGFQ